MSEAAAPPPARASKGPLIGAVVGAVVVVAVVVGAAFVAGRAVGDADGKNVDVIKAKREMLRKIEQSAKDAEAQTAQLKPVVLALQEKENKLEADNAAALEKLRGRWRVECGEENLKTTTPTAPPDAAVALGEALRGDYPCGGDGAAFNYEEKPKVSLDVVAFGEFSGGACAGTTVVRVTLRCSYIDFFQNCGGDSDGCERFKPPPPTYSWNDEWGCIRESGISGGGSSLAPASDCPQGDDEEGEFEKHEDGAHLFWALRGSQAIYLAGSSEGWAELGDAEAAPGVQHAADLKLAFRNDDSVHFVVEELPDSFALGAGQLDSVGEERTDLNVAGTGTTVDTSVVSDEGDGAWKRVTRDGRARLYKERLEPSRDFDGATELIKGVTLGVEHVCQRTDRKPDAAGLTKVGVDKNGAALWVDGTPTPGPVAVVLWTSPFGNLWTCNNRVMGPYKDFQGDPEWEDPTTDADREQYPWCFQ